MADIVSVLSELLKVFGQMPQQQKPVTPSGLLVPGTIKNLYDRPVLKNPDGSVSTTLSMSFEEDGKSVLIPQVINGKKLKPAEAIAHYHKTGEHLGVFDTPANASQYAEWLHSEQAKRAGLGQ
jgi:hypothetical protein